MISCRKLASCLLVCLIGVATIMPACASMQPQHDGLRPFAESCPEFLVCDPDIIHSASLFDASRRVRLRIVIPTGKTNGDNVKLNWKVWKLDGTEVKDHLLTFRSEPADMKPVVGNSPYSTTIDPGAIVLRNLDEPLIVDVTAQLVHGEAPCAKAVAGSFLILPKGAPALHAFSKDGFEASSDSEFRAESCPEFAVVSPLQVYAGSADATDRTVQVRVRFRATGSITGENVQLTFWPKYEDGSLEQNLGNVFDSWRLTPVAVSTSGAREFLITGAAVVKRGLSRRMVVEVEAVLTKDAKQCRRMVDEFEIIPGESGRATEPAGEAAAGVAAVQTPEAADRQPDGVAESCPEFLNRSPFRDEYRGGSPIGLKFFPLGAECNPTAANVKLSYHIVEVQSDGTLTQVTRQSTFGSSAPDLAPERGVTITSLATSKRRHVVITARCNEGCVALPAIATKTTDFWIVP